MGKSEPVTSKETADSILLLMIKYNLRKCVSATVNWRASQYLEDFSAEMHGDINT